MESASGFGIIAGGLLLSTWGGFNRKIVTSLCGIIGIGIGTSLIGFAPANIFAMAIAGAVVSGAMVPIANGPLGALLQSVIRRDMQGRVMALVNSAATAISPIGLLIAGPLSDSIGIRTWYWFAGICTILMAVSGFLIPTVMTVETNHNDMNGSVPISTQ
jgi:DHA3 family macrolide efflux protein-like MFS transporter